MFVLGYGKNPRDRKILTPGVIRKDTAYRVLKKFSTDTSVENALTELAEYWDKLLGVYTPGSGDEKLNRMVNIWHQYQCMVTFNMSRSASYFESGTGRGMGFRTAARICWVLSTWRRSVPGNASSTLPPSSGRTAPPIISTSL